MVLINIFQLSSREALLIGIFLALCAMASIDDIKTGEIRNEITYTGMISGIILTLLTDTDMIMKMCIFLGIFLIAPLVIGMGDVKLLMAASVLMPPVWLLCGFILSQIVFIICFLILRLQEQTHTSKTDTNGQPGTHMRYDEERFGLPFAPCFLISMAMMITVTLIQGRILT